MAQAKESEKGAAVYADEAVDVRVGEIENINASGHIQELDRNFSLWSIVGMAVTSGNTWTALAGSIVIAINNGGPPGVIYEFIASSFFYWLIAASLGELASSVPSSGGIYHWSSITGGRVVGFFGGWWNLLAWMFAVAALCQISAFQLTSMWSLYHTSYVVQRWHVFVIYELINLLCVLVVIYYNKALPMIQFIGGWITVVGCIATVLTCVIMGRGRYASDRAVWVDWTNRTGWQSDGFVFCLGMLNGAFSLGVPDLISHMAEEVPHPSRNLPIALFAQYLVGFVTAFVFMLSIFYTTTDLEAVFNASQTYLYPLTEIYRQATNSLAGALCLNIIIFVQLPITIMGNQLVASRALWAIARDKGMPLSSTFSRVSLRNRNPTNALVACATFGGLIGFIYLGSATAFAAFVGSFIVLGSISYLTAILPHLLSGRSKIEPGWFWMGRAGWVVNGIACAYILVFAVIFMFPASSTVTAATMNWTCVMTGGTTLMISCFWLWCKRGYTGPPPFQQRELVTAKDAL